MERLTTIFRNNWVTIALLCLLIFGALLRAFLYGNLNLSIGNPDTPSYVDSSKAPIFSKEIFTGRRLFTTNMLYKLANDPQECPLQIISYPAEGKEGHRAIQPCFDRIVLLQNLVAIFAWCFLAWTTAHWIKSPLYKFIVVLLILAFGFTPEIAEWDSVLSPESLSNSMFAILIALLQQIILLETGNEQGKSFPKTVWLIPLWFIVLVLWVFIRDVHLYALLITVALTLPLLLLRAFRRSIYLPAILVLSLALFVFGNLTSRESTRWQPSLDHALTDYIHPYPARVEFFHSLGMPTERPSPEYDIWFQDTAINSYGRFLISHPGFVISTIFTGSYFKSDFVQPYFPAGDIQYREFLLTVGEFLHPTTYAVYLIDLLLLISLCCIAFNSGEQRIYGMAWLALWIFLYLSISLFISFFGDTNGTGRHIFPSVEGFRLFGWIFLMINMDLAARKQPVARLASVTI